jgi:hypothetical protein
MKKLYLKQHDSTPMKFIDRIVTSLITNRSCKLTSVFKENMISDYLEEFLKRLYSLNESLERLPRIANYYKNYSKFFCRPRFGDLQINVLLESNGDIKAELYYKQNYIKTQESFEKLETLLTTTVKHEIDENVLTVRKSESILGTSVSYLNEHAIINSSGLLTAKQSKNTSLIALLYNLEPKVDKTERTKKDKYNISTFDRTKVECSKNSETRENKELKVDNIEKIEKIVVANKAASNIKLGFAEKSRNQRKSLDNKNSSIVKTLVSQTKVNALKTTIAPQYPKYTFQTLDKKPNTSKPKIVLTKPNIDKLTKQISKIGKEQINKLIKKETTKILYASIDKLDRSKGMSKEKNAFMTLNQTPSQANDIKIVNNYKKIQTSRNVTINIKQNLSNKPQGLGLIKKQSVDFKVKEMVEGINKYKNHSRNKPNQSKVESSLEKRIFNTCNYIKSIGKDSTNLEQAKKLISNKLAKQNPKK